MKTTLEGINSRITEAEERISDLEDRMVEFTAEEQNKKKRMKRNEDSLRHLWANIKHNNIHVIGVPEGEEREKRNEDSPRDLWDNIKHINIQIIGVPEIGRASCRERVSSPV